MHMALRGAVAEEPVREAEGAGPVGDQGALAGDVEGAETGAGEYLGYVGEALRVPFWVGCKDGIALGGPWEVALRASTVCGPVTVEHLAQAGEVGEDDVDTGTALRCPPRVPGGGASARAASCCW